MTLATVSKTNVTIVINANLHMLGFCLLLEIPSVFATKIGLDTSRNKKTNNLDKLF